VGSFESVMNLRVPWKAGINSDWLKTISFFKKDLASRIHLVVDSSSQDQVAIFCPHGRCMFTIVATHAIRKTLEIPKALAKVNQI
jgi:hypothetical protein